MSDQNRRPNSDGEPSPADHPGAGPKRMSVLEMQVEGIRAQALAAAQTMEAIAVQCTAFLGTLAMMRIQQGPPVERKRDPREEEGERRPTFGRMKAPPESADRLAARIQAADTVTDEATGGTDGP